MLFSSENNCNNSIETIIKDKITLIDNNSNNNNLINFNLTSNLNTLNNLNELNKLSLTNKTFNNNENANYLQQSICSISSPSITRPDLAVNPLLLSPLDKENAKEIIQQKILDNVYITQKINEVNQELVNYLTNIKEDENKRDNVLLSPIDFDLISNNSNNLLLNNGIVTNDVYPTPNLSVNQITSSPESNGLYLDPMVYSSPSQSGEETLTFPPSNELTTLENIIQNSPNALLANSTTLPSIISTPNSQILSSPLNNSFISSPALTNTHITSPESNTLSSPELYDTMSPELNLNKATFNDLTVEEYLHNQEILKLQQEALMKSVLNTETQMPSNILMDQSFISSPEDTQGLLSNTLDSLPLNLENISEIINELVPEEPSKEILPEEPIKEQIQKRKFEELSDDDEEEEEEESNKKSKKENVINEGKPFIYVVTESDDEDDETTNSEEDGQKKKKYKKKYYVCSVCNHKSKRHYNVEVHLKTHEKNRPKPFVCDICNKSFCRIHVLERHKITHQEKMYSCELCGKKFGRLDSLKRHVGCKTCVKKQKLLNNEKN